MTRLKELEQLFIDILGSDHVYFQPPESFRMKYPAIRYELSDIFNVRADNIAYHLRHQYTVTYIDKKPDSPIVDQLAALPLCRFERSYRADNLNHYTFVLYF